MTLRDEGEPSTQQQVNMTDETQRRGGGVGSGESVSSGRRIKSGWLLPGEGAMTGKVLLWFPSRGLTHTPTHSTTVFTQGD